MTTPKDRTCPNCGAGPGSPCKRPSGHAVFGGGFHKAREKGECNHTGRCVTCRHCLGNPKCWDRCQGHEGAEKVTTQTETKAAVGGKVRVLGENLRAALATVKGAVARRATLPITVNVLIETTGDSRLKLTTTDLEKAITTTIGAQVDEPLSITVPFRMLVDVVKALPAGAGTLETAGPKLVVSG